MRAYETKRYSDKIDAKGDTILIKFHNQGWHCIGYKRKSTFHPSLASAHAHVEYTWDNYVLKVIDHNGCIVTKDKRQEPEPLIPSQKIARDIWCPPPLPPEPKEPSKPVWLPSGVSR